MARPVRMPCTTFSMHASWCRWLRARLSSRTFTASKSGMRAAPARTGMSGECDTAEAHANETRTRQPHSHCTTTHQGHRRASCVGTTSVPQTFAQKAAGTNVDPEKTWHAPACPSGVLQVAQGCRGERVWTGAQPLTEAVWVVAGIPAAGCQGTPPAKPLPPAPHPSPPTTEPHAGASRGTRVQPTPARGGEWRATRHRHGPEHPPPRRCCRRSRSCHLTATSAGPCRGASPMGEPRWRRAWHWWHAGWRGRAAAAVPASAGTWVCGAACGVAPGASVAPPPGRRPGPLDPPS